MRFIKSCAARAVAVLAFVPVVAACGDDDAIQRRDSGDSDTSAPDIPPPDVEDVPEPEDTFDTPDMNDTVDTTETETVAPPDTVEETADAEVALCPVCGPLARCDDPAVGCVCVDPVNTRLVGSRCYPLDFVDPDLDRDPDGAWSVGGTNITHQQSGSVDPGSWAILSGSLSQTLDVPPWAAVPKLAVDLYGASFVGTGTWDFATGDGQVALPIPGFDITVPYRQCLGEAGHGDGVSFGLLARFLTVDRMTLVEDETCPDPGVLRDGDFSGGGSAWVLERGAIVDNGAIASDDPGLVLPVDDPCAPARATQRISVPLAGVNALRFKVRTRPGTTLGVALRERYPVSASVETNGLVETVSFCFTRFERGMVMPLTFVPLTPSGAQCVPGAAGLAEVDDVEFFDDSGCDSESLVSDPDFSRLGPLVAGSLAINEVVRTTLEAPDAFDERSLRIDALPCPEAGDAQAWYDVATRWPPRTTESGPAVRFVYKTTGNPTGFVGTPDQTFPASATWTPYSGCVGGAVDGFVRFLRIGLPSCGAHTLALDELEVFADPACRVGR